MNEIRLVYNTQQAEIKKSQRKAGSSARRRDELDMSQLEIEKQFERDFCG